MRNQGVEFSPSSIKLLLAFTVLNALMRACLEQCESEECLDKRQWFGLQACLLVGLSTYTARNNRLNRFLEIGVGIFLPWTIYRGNQQMIELQQRGEAECFSGACAWISQAYSFVGLALMFLMHWQAVTRPRPPEQPTLRGPG